MEYIYYQVFFYWRYWKINQSLRMLQYFMYIHLLLKNWLLNILLSFLHLVVKMRLVQFCSIKRSSVCGLKFGGGVVFSQICSVASGAFKEQYTLLVSLNLSVSERKPSTSSDHFFAYCKCLLISTICVIAYHVLNSNNTAKPEKNIETHSFLKGRQG